VGSFSGNASETRTYIGRDSWSNHGPRIGADSYFLRFWEPPRRVFPVSYELTGFFHCDITGLREPEPWNIVSVLRCLPI
jgi:hypothetical protein